jgi:hypothetical protein
MGSNSVREHNTVRCPHGLVPPCKCQPAVLFRHAEGCDDVAALIARIQKPSPRIQRNVTWIVTPGRRIVEMSQHSTRPNRECCNRIMEPVGGIQKASVRRRHNLGTEVRTREALRQGGDCLPMVKAPHLRLVVEKRHGGGFLLDGVQPAPIRMKREMPWPIARGETHKRSGGRREPPMQTRSRVELSEWYPVGIVLFWPSSRPASSCDALTGSRNHGELKGVKVSGQKLYLV